MKNQLKQILSEKNQTVLTKELLVHRDRLHNKMLSEIFYKLDLLQAIEKNYKISTLEDSDGNIKTVQVIDIPP